MVARPGTQAEFDPVKDSVEEAGSNVRFHANSIARLFYLVESLR